MSTSQRVSWVFSAFVTLTVPTLLWAGEDKEAVLAKCKLKAMELYTRKECRRTRSFARRSTSSRV